MRLLLVGICVSTAPMVMSARASAAFPPIAQATIDTQQVLVGSMVQLRGSASSDPDNGPQPLSYAWDFGDGTTSSLADPVHVFREARAYPVRLTVSDGADSSAATVIVHVLHPPASSGRAHSSPLALTADGKALWVANPDSDSVTLLDVTAAPFKAAEVPVCKRPRSLALTNGDTALLVTCQDAGALAAIDVGSRTMSAVVPVGHGPYAVVVTSAGRVLVTLQDDGELLVLSSSLVEVARVVVGDTPRALAVDGTGQRAYVTRFITRGEEGKVVIVDAAASEVVDEVGLVDDPGPDTPSSGRGVPNVLAAAALDPAERVLWVGGLKANTSSGLYRTGAPIASENWVRGVAAPVDVLLASERLVRRIDTNNADSVSAIVFSPDGRYGYFAHQGAGSVSIYDLSLATLYDPGAASTVPFSARVEVGSAPQGLAISPDGRRLCVSNFMSRDVSVIDVGDPGAPRVTATVRVTSEILPADVALGKRHFHASSEPVHSKSNYIACASCHPDGGMSDGRVWDFAQKGEGLRNTKDLRGVAGLGDGLVHWSGNFDEIQDFELDIVATFGGSGLAADGQPPNPSLGASNAGRSQDLDALAVYVSSLVEAPPSPWRLGNGGLSRQAQRGRELFFKADLRCTECHQPPRYTISAAGALSDTGTMTPASGARLGEALPGIDVPSLAGLWASPPYFHDGSAATLHEVFRGRPQVLEAQLTAGLSDAQLADLEAFLLSLDDHDDPPERTQSEGCTGVGPGTLWMAFAGVLVLGRRCGRGGWA